MAVVSQSVYNSFKRPLRRIYIKINLLDLQYNVIDTLEGNLINGSISSDGNSNLRNSCNISMVVTDASFNVQDHGKIWLDRLVKIYVGINDMSTGEVAWTNKGMFLINQPTYKYDSTNKELSFQGVDLMAKMTGLRDGYLTYNYLIPAGSNVKSVINAIANANGFTKTILSECKNVDGSIQNVPNDLSYDQGATWADILNDLQNILPNYQIYFDTDGVLHYEQIPYRANEPIRMDDDIWAENVIEESVQYDFESVKNVVKVLGKTHEIDNYPSEQTVSGATLNLTIASVTELKDNVMIGFTPPSAISGNISINVSGLGAKALVNDNGSRVTSLNANEYYVAIYQSGQWRFMGHLQAEGEWKDTNPASPFYIGNTVGDIPIVLYGGEYENIPTDDLAKQRAKWEIYQRARLNDTINISCVPIYWAEVNWMVEYTSITTGQSAQYMIKSIDTDLSYDGVQTFVLAKYYPYYE